MNEPKHYWNDKRPEHTYTVIICPDCRALCDIRVDHYPHGPNTVMCCPICGSKEIRRNP